MNIHVQTLTAQLTRYESEISQYQATVSQLENNLGALHDAFATFKGRSAYTIEFMRSILISIETLVHEEEKMDFAISQTIGREITCGLEECDQWNKA